MHKTLLFLASMSFIFFSSLIFASDSDQAVVEETCRIDADCSNRQICNNGSCIPLPPNSEPAIESTPTRQATNNTFQKCSSTTRCTANGLSGSSGCEYTDGSGGLGVGGGGGGRRMSEESCRRELGITNAMPRHPSDRFDQCFTERECTRNGTSFITKCCYFIKKTKRKYCLTDRQGMSAPDASPSGSQPSREAYCKSFTSEAAREAEKADHLFGAHRTLRRDNNELKDKNKRLTNQYGDLKAAYKKLEERCGGSTIEVEDPIQPDDGGDDPIITDGIGGSTGMGGGGTGMGGGSDGGSGEGTGSVQ